MTSASTAAGVDSAAPTRPATNVTSATSSVRAAPCPAVIMPQAYVVGTMTVNESEVARVMRRWLARLAFSFILLALVFVWEGYRTRRGDRGPGQEGRMYAFFVAAAVCFGLGLRGI